jgi:hypothetical protein
MANVRDISEKTDSPTNPYKVNQFTLDPRQLLCWKSYTDPKSETFGNARQSAIKAGYEEDYANQITVTEWFKVKVRRIGLLDKAEKVLEETLDLDTLDEEGKKDKGLHALKLDAAKFIAKTQGKNEGYSERQELTGKDGAPLPTPILNGVVSSSNATNERGEIS